MLHLEQNLGKFDAIFVGYYITLFTKMYLLHERPVLKPHGIQEVGSSAMEPMFEKIAKRPKFTMATLKYPLMTIRGPPLAVNGKSRMF